MDEWRMDVINVLKKNKRGYGHNLFQKREETQNSKYPIFAFLLCQFFLFILW